MKKTAYRIIGLLPMLALCISALVYFFFGIAQLQYKNAAHQNIAYQKGLYKITVPLKDFNKQAGNGEFWYAGQLYDISSYTVRNDSACVVIFHDEQEESLVKSIADSFNPYDNYTPDNVVHIVKHRIHILDDSKILATPPQLTHTPAVKERNTFRYTAKYSSPVYGTVLKPPPNIS